MKTLILTLTFLGVCAALEKPSPGPIPSSEKKKNEAAKPDETGKNQQCGTKDNPCVIAIPPSTAREIEAQYKAANGNDKATWERTTAISTAALAVITFGLAFYTAKLWSATKTLAKEAKESGDAAIQIAKETASAAKISADAAIQNATAASKNAEFSEINAIATREAAEAAAKNADAAAKNIEMFVSRERARLTIEMKPLTLKPQSGSYDVEFAIVLHGSTEAFISESACAAYFVFPKVTEDPESGKSILLPIMKLPKIMSPTNRNIESLTVWQWKPDRDVISEIRGNKMHVGFRGWIKYKDVFDRERITKFRYTWKYFETVLGQVLDFGNWEASGTPDENMET